MKVDIDMDENALKMLAYLQTVPFKPGGGFATTLQEGNIIFHVNFTDAYNMKTVGTDDFQYYIKDN